MNESLEVLKLAANTLIEAGLLTVRLREAVAVEMDVADKSTELGGPGHGIEWSIYLFPKLVEKVAVLCPLIEQLRQPFLRRPSGSYSLHLSLSGSIEELVIRTTNQLRAFNKISGEPECFDARRRQLRDALDRSFQELPIDWPQFFRMSEILASEREIVAEYLEQAKPTAVMEVPEWSGFDRIGNWQKRMRVPPGGAWDRLTKNDHSTEWQAEMSGTGRPTRSIRWRMAFLTEHYSWAIKASDKSP